MDVKEITADVIKNYIRKMAYKKHKPEEQIQVVLFLKSPKEVGVYLLEQYQPSEDDIKLKDVLGTWVMAYGIVNGFISKSLQKFAEELECDFKVVNCMLWLENDEVSLCIYNKHTPYKRITIDELLKE